MAIMYSLGPEMPSVSLGQLTENETEYWRAACLRWTEPHPHQLHHEIERLFTASAMGLRAATAKDGRFDASIWQYGYEWSGDAANIAEALVYSGQFEVAQSVLENILTRMTIPEGMAMESSRFRGGQDAELNNNGEILKACRTYFDWTGDREFIESHYDRIAAIANYLLRPEFLHNGTGMLMASRDIWERNAAVGILPGFDVAHQTFGILGLRDASYIAKAFSKLEDVERWTVAGKKMRQSFLEHPTHSMIENNRIIKRRLLDGSVQTELTITNTGSDFQKQFVPDGMPLATSGPKLWEPDISECFPIALGVIDPRSDTAKNTIETMDALWSQAWEDGGYGRYNVLSEPDSPGPWPLATMYMAAACLEAADTERGQRAISWLIEKAGAGGSWFEFYGDRPTPPLPPTGILVWAWAQWITLVVKHILGAQVKDDQLIIRPRLGGFSGELRFRDSSASIPNGM
jgi:GH15 family glucan-1,4-alpha-glucosidase